MYEAADVANVAKGSPLAPGYLSLCQDSIPNPTKIRQGIQIKSEIDASVIELIGRKQECFQIALDNAVNSRFLLDLGVFQKEFLSQVSDVINYPSSKLLFVRKVRSAALYAHFTIYKEAAKAKCPTIPVLRKTEQISNLIQAKHIDNFFTHENLFNELSKHRENADMSGVNVESYFVKARAAQKEIEVFMETVLALTTLVSGALEKNVILEVASWITDYQYGDLFSGRPGWLSFLFEDSYHWLTGIERHSRAKRRRLTNAETATGEEPVDSLGLTDCVPDAPSQSSASSSSSAKSAMEQQPKRRYVDCNKASGNIFYLLDLVEEATRKRGREEEDCEESHLAHEDSTAYHQVMNLVEESNQTADDSQSVTITDSAIADDPQAVERRAKVDGVDIIDLTADEVHCQDTLAAVEDTTLANDHRASSSNASGFDLTKIEKEFAYLFFLHSSLHAAKYVYSKCLELVDQQKQLSCDRAYKTKKSIYEFAKQLSKNIRHQQGATRFQLVKKLNDTLWAILLKLYAVYVLHRQPSPIAGNEHPVGNLLNIT